METLNGVSDGAPPPPSPLTGCYLLIVIGEPHSQEHKDIILRRVAKGLLSWDLGDCMVDLEKELAIITEQAPEGEEARYGERLIQYASENLVTEILIHPAVSTLSQCVRNLLSSFTRHRHIIHSGYTFAANGSWALQDGTFSLADFSEAFQELEVQRVIRAYDNGISVDIHCSSEGDWTRLPKEAFAKNCKVRLNPVDVLPSSSPAIADFLNYITPFLVPLDIVTALESSEVVGNIRFSHPTLYVFPGGQGDAALFGINGFNMLLDGGFSRKACFWDFVRHLDRLDAVLLTRLNNSNVSGIMSVLKRKRQNAVYPQIGHFFCNIQERKALLSPDGDKDRDPLLINLMDEGQDIVTNLKHLNLHPQACYRDSEPINLYHKVGHGTLDMYVLSPAKDSREVREFIQKWNSNDNRLFANPKTKEFSFPLPNLVSICALLVWQPSNSSENITRILFPGSTPQSKIFEGLDRLKQLDCIKYPICSEITLNPPKKTKEHIFDSSKSQKILPEVKKEKSPRLIDLKPKEHKDAAKQQDNITNDIPEKKKEIKKSDSTDSDKSATKPNNKTDAKPIKDAKETTAAAKTPRVKDKDAKSVERKPAAKIEKKPSPTTPKKTIANGDAPKPKAKVSPTATPAKSAKEATNRKVFESKKQAPKEKKDPKPADKKAEPEKKVERKPISRRPKAAAAPAPAVKPATGSPIRKKPESIAKKAKLDKEGTTDSSTVSTPTADGDLKRDISKLTPEELDQLKAQELADLQEEQEVVQEIEAVFRKGEERDASESEMRKIKNISIEEKTDEEYLVVEKVEAQEVQEEEMQKLTRDSEESEKQRKLSEPKGEAVKEIISPEEKVDKVESGTQPDEKFSATVESGATTAPTLPEDERIPLDEIKEKDDTQAIEEKHVKEETKEKESIPVIQLPSKSIDATPPVKPAPVVGIRLDKQQHIRDIVKTPDEVADLPVHEVADHYVDYQKNTDEQTTMIVKEALQDAKTDVQKGVQEVKDEVKAVVDEIIEESKDIVDNKAKETVEAAVAPAEVVEESADIVEDAVEESKKAVEETISEVQKTAVDISNVIKEDVVETKEVVTQEIEKVVEEIQIEAKESHVEVVEKVEVKETVCSIKQTTAEVTQAMKETVIETKETIEKVNETMEAVISKVEENIEETKEDLAEQTEDNIKLDEAPTEEHKSTIINDAHELDDAVKDDQILKHIDEITSTAKDAIDMASKKVTEITEEVNKIKEDAEKAVQEKIDGAQSIVAEEVSEIKEDLERIAEVKDTLSDKVSDVKESIEAKITDIVKTGEAIIEEGITKKDEVESSVKDVVAEKVAAGNEYLDDLAKTIETTATSSITITKETKEQLESAVKDEVESSVTTITDSITHSAESTKASVEESIIKTTEEVTEKIEALTTTTSTLEQEAIVKSEEIEATITEKTDSFTGFLSKGLAKLEETTKTIADKVIEGVEKVVDEIKQDAKPSEVEVPSKVEVDEPETIETSIVVENVDVELPQIINIDGSPESPCQTPFDFIDKVDLGRKSPKEREEDVAKIVASVAEVLKSEAPLEDFKGKIPLEITTFPTFTPYTTELRETHITTVDSPTTDLPGQITPIKEEKMDEVLKEMEDDIDSNSNKSQVSALMQANQDLLEALSSGIKEEDEDEEADVEETVDKGTVHRMLVTASSEDGGEETVICPPGSITFPKSSESSGKSSPDIRRDDNQKPEQSSPESSQDAPSVLQKEPEISAKMKSEDIPETKDKVDKDERKASITITEQDNKITEALELEAKSGKSTPDKRTSLDANKDEQKSGKSTPDIPKSGKATPDILTSGTATPDIKSDAITSSEMSQVDIETSGNSIPIYVMAGTVTDIAKSAHETCDKVSSGKSTPDQVNLDKEESDTKSGKTSPAVPEIGTADISKSETILESRKETPDIRKTDQGEIVKSGTTSPDIVKNDLAVDAAKSGKATPDIPTSGTATPDITKVDVDDESAKGTPDIAKSGKSTPDIPKSGKVTPDIAKSGKSTPDIAKSDKETPDIAKLGKSTPDILKSGMESQEIAKSGKSTPEISMSGKETPDIQKSGKSTPDISKSDKETLDEAKSAKSTPETPKSEKEAVHISESGKSTPDIPKPGKEIAAIAESGKTTPDIPKSGKDTPDIAKSGKSTPDIPKSGKETPDIPKSGKSTPDIPSSVEETPDIAKSDKETAAFAESGKSTPDIPKSDKDTPDIIKSGKSTPEITKSDKETPDIAKSGISTPEIPKSGKETPDITKSGKVSPDIPRSGKETPDIAKSGKSTPDIPQSVKETPDIAKSGKSTPDIPKSGKETPDIQKSGKSTPDIPQSVMEIPDIAKSEKATPDIPTSGKEITDVSKSGITTPDIPKSGKETPDVAKSRTPTPDIHKTEITPSEVSKLGPISPGNAHKEAPTSGKSTPDIKTDDKMDVIAVDTAVNLSKTGKPPTDIPCDKPEPITADQALNGTMSPEAGSSLTEASTIIEDTKITSVTESCTVSRTEERTESIVSQIQEDISGKSSPDAARPNTESSSMTCCTRVDAPKTTGESNHLADGLDSGKSTPDLNNISGKSSPDIHKSPVLSKRGSAQIEKSPALSGKATPDLPKSGISSPDFGKGDSIKLDTDSLASGKATPDINIDLPSSVAPHSIQMDTDSLASGKMTPDLKHDLSSGKATPDVDKHSTHIETDSLASGKMTPDVAKADVLSGKSTPDVCKRDSLVVEKTSSGKSTPDSNQDEVSSKKSSIQIDDNGQVSGKSSPDMSKSPKSAIDTKDDSLHIDDQVHSDKSTSNLHKAQEDKMPSGKSTPDTLPQSKKDSIQIEDPSSLKVDSQVSGKSTPDLKTTATSDSRKSSINIEDVMSGKSTPDLNKDEQIQSRKGSQVVGEVVALSKVESGKTTPLEDEILTQRKESVQLTADKVASGKSTPEILDSKRGSLTVEKVASGKSTPDITDAKKDAIHIDDKPSVKSGKSTPDLGKLETMTIDSVMHKDEEPILDSQKDDSAFASSGKSTPEPEPLQCNLPSGKSTPISPDHQNGLSRDSIASGKSTPGLSGKVTPEPDISSGKGTPEPTTDFKIDTKEEMKALSGKSTPDSGFNAANYIATTTTTSSSSVVTTAETLKQELKTHSFSGTPSPDFSKRSSIQAEHILSGKSTPDSTKRIHDDSGKSTPDFGKRSSIQVEHILSGKSTPDFGKVDSPASKKDSLPTSGQSTPLKGKTSPDALSDVQGKQTDTVTEVPTSFDVTQLQSAHVFRELMEETITSSFDEKKSQNGDVIHEKHETSHLELVKETVSGKSTPEFVKDSRKSSVMSGADDSDYRKFSITSENTKTSSLMSGKSTPERKEDKHSVQAFIDAERQLEGTSSPAKSDGKSSLGDIMSTSAFLADPMSTSFYGALPDDSDDEDIDTPPRRNEPDLMTSSFIGDLPTDDKTEEEIRRWGKPLGLPSPAPPTDNKGTPKKDKRLPLNVSVKNKLNQRSESPSKKKKINPIYVDLTYVPQHGNSYYSQVDFFKRVRARYYVFSGIEPSKDVYNALLEAKQTWEDKDLEVTIIPTYDTDVLGYWVAENEELLTKHKIDLSPSASRCTINLQDHETSCSAYRLEF